MGSPQQHSGNGLGIVDGSTCAKRGSPTSWGYPKRRTWISMRGVKSQDRGEKEWEDADRITLGATLRQLGRSLVVPWMGLGCWRPAYK